MGIQQLLFACGGGIIPGSVTLNVGSGDISANNWTSATYTTLAGCSNITPSVALKSTLGNGAGGQYYYRSIRWRVEYWDGSAWIALSWRIVNMGAQSSSAVNDSGLFSFPSPGVWQWRLYAEQYNTDGSAWGTISYTYSSETRSQTSGNGYAKADASSAAAFQTISNSTSITLAAKTKTDEIYQIAYSWSAAVGMNGEDYSSYDSFGALASAVYSSQPGNYFSSATVPTAPSPSGYTRTSSTPSVGYHRLNWSKSCSSTVSGSNLTYSQTYISASMAYTKSVSSIKANGYWVDTTLSGGSATIYYRAPVPTSITPINNTYIFSYAYA